jgi:hypothetical protein
MTNEKNKQLEELLGYFNEKLKTQGIDNLSLEYVGEDGWGPSISFVIPTHEDTQREIQLYLTHDLDIPYSAREYVALATRLGASAGVFSFSQLLDCPKIGQGIPGLEMARNLFEAYDTLADLYVNPAEGELGMMLSAQFSGEDIIKKSASPNKYEHRIADAKNMREIVDLAFEIYNS